MRHVPPGTTASTYDGLTPRDLAERLAVPNVLLYDEVSSTLDVAHAVAAAGAPPGTLVLAETQREGRGRMGRTWRSERGSGIWLTVVERPASEDSPSVGSLRVALRLAAALEPFTDAPLRVKWPNDLFAGDRKLAGILLEARWHASRLDWIAAGVGLNLRVPHGLPGAALRPGTARLAVLDVAVPAIRSALGTRGLLTAEELAQYHARDLAIGRASRAPAEGIVSGVDAEGALLIETPAGRTVHRGGSLVLADRPDL